MIKLKFEKENMKVEFEKSINGSCVSITQIDDDMGEKRKNYSYIDFKDLEWIFEKYLEYKRTREKDEQLEFLYHFADIGVVGASNRNKIKLDKIKKTFS
ncbi:MAG: hypothetical protein U9Q73_01800 [Nanoarchaeota archaeon]|nr:hypothetical protein [Nanoarchaeota archaeon]